MAKRKKMRQTIRTGIWATVVYPKAGSLKSETADINIDISDKEALHMAQYLIEGARKSKRFTIRAVRKPSKNKLHQITLSHEMKYKK